MSSQTTNIYPTASTSPNPYITRRLNDMDKAKMMKAERNNWTKTYHKTLKGLEAMIDMQKQIKEIVKIVAETNTAITEMENSILKASTNNQVINATNIIGVSEDLQYLIQSDMEDQVFQIQRMLTDELDAYKEKGNTYVNSNIQEIQELYKDKEVKKEKERIENEKMILIKPYEISESTSSTTQSSFITDEVNNLIKYMKFVQVPTQTRIFQPPPYYQSLKSRDEQDAEFWMEVAKALVDNKHNTETSRNSYQITMFQGGPPYEPYFIAIDNRGQVIIGPNKKTVTTYVVGELEVLI